jgi:hypothetical protein
VSFVVDLKPLKSRVVEPEHQSLYTPSFILMISLKPPLCLRTRLGRESPIPLANRAPTSELGARNRTSKRMLTTTLTFPSAAKAHVDLDPGSCMGRNKKLILDLIKSAGSDKDCLILSSFNHTQFGIHVIQTRGVDVASFEITSTETNREEAVRMRGCEWVVMSSGMADNGR